IAKAKAARKQLLVIERKRIGAVSHELEALARAERTQGVDSGTAATRRAELQVDFEALQAGAAAIRAELADSRLLVRSVEGREAAFPASTLIGVFPSTRANLARRLGEMIHRVWNFLSDEPREANTEGGVFPAIFGTVV